MVDSVYFLVYTISTILTILFITLGRGGIPHRQYSLQRTEYFFVPESAQFRYRRLLCIVRMRKVMKKAVYAAHFSVSLRFALLVYVYVHSRRQSRAFLELLASPTFFPFKLAKTLSK